MYLTKLAMNPSHPSVRQALSDRQDMHRNLMKACREGLLYRVVETRTSLQVLTLTRALPEMPELEKNGYSLLSYTDLASLPSLYGADSVLRFGLLTSPSKKIENPDGKNSRRVFLREPEERAGWLAGQGSKYGFEVLQSAEIGVPQSIRVGRSSGSFIISAVAFEGILKIVDAAQFWQAWETGIGPEKAYGLGLMLLMR